jgi:hypothetical protein
MQVRNNKKWDYGVYQFLQFASKRQNYLVLKLNPIPARLCHVIYYCIDKSYSCLVGIVLNKIIGTPILKPATVKFSKVHGVKAQKVHLLKSIF